MPGFPVHHQLLELAQTHVHSVGDAIQPSNPLSSPYPLTFNLAQHQCLQMSQFFASGGQSIGVSPLAAFLPKNSCFQIVVLEKTLDSPLDSKEIKPVNPKGKQP